MVRSVSIRAFYFFLALLLINTYIAKANASKLDINKATVKQLIEVKGIGKAKAQAIVKFIKSKKGIKKMDELLAVKGIGKNTLKNIESKFATAGKDSKKTAKTKKKPSKPKKAKQPKPKKK
jgi:competence protein ComEA